MDIQSRLYMPQAGSTDTIAATTEGGWALRTADGHTLYFNEMGYLVNDRDRFGNGFSIEYQQTPLFQLYENFCNRGALGSRNEMKSSRRCAVLTYLMEDGPRPLQTDPSWAVTASDYDDLPQELAYARDYFLYVLGKGPDVQSVFGARRLRPIRVVDDLGGALRFSYYRAAPPQQATAVRDGTHFAITRGSDRLMRSQRFNFIAAPYAELLERVEGPAGTSLGFQYSAPPRYPQVLNELFLVRMDRHDATPAATVDVEPSADRWIEFVYQWAGRPYDQYASKVYQAYRDYYETFVGCAYCTERCSGGQCAFQGATGSPEALARLEMHAYVGDVSDNIVQVINSGLIESETRYEPHPRSPVFDHVTAQRYGSHRVQQNAKLLPPDEPTDRWQTTLPRSVIVYLSAGPVRAGSREDRTDSDHVLPAEIRQRYPLETVPLQSPGAPGARPVGTEVGEIKACNYTLMDERRETLPGYRPTLPYFDVTKTEKHPNFGSLYRSRLICEQLAIAELANPTHNDLLSELVPIKETPVRSDHVAVRIVGQRHVVAANMNRICSWTKVIDRDGHLHYYGLNYRGQVLVDAVKVTQPRPNYEFLFSETVYNADGMVMQERRPTQGPAPWHAMDGLTAYMYQEIDPTGTQGWNEWLPVFWSRRTNVTRVEEHAAGFSITDELETSSGVYTTRVGRFQDFTYEPLFNQIKSVVSGSIEYVKSPSWRPVRTDVAQRRLDYVFDYQELGYTDATPLASRLKPVLDQLKPWGFTWIEKKTASGAFEYDYQAIQSWQLPLKFHERDLNADGIRGFGYGSQEYQRARGVPILAISQPLTSAVSPLVSTTIWGPHGLPAVVTGPDGAKTVLEYYSLGSPRGGTVVPTDQQVSIGFRGFLARVHTRRFAPDYPQTYGPPEAPCAALGGPYQWLLPATCANDPEKELRDLGLPPQTVAVIMASVTVGSSERWSTTSFSYSGSSSWRVGDFHLFSDRIKHAREDLEAQVLFVA